MSADGPDEARMPSPRRHAARRLVATIDYAELYSDYSFAYEHANGSRDQKGVLNGFP